MNKSETKTNTTVFKSNGYTAILKNMVITDFLKTEIEIKKAIRNKTKKMNVSADPINDHIEIHGFDTCKFSNEMFNFTICKNGSVQRTNKRSYPSRSSLPPPRQFSPIYTFASSSSSSSSAPASAVSATLLFAPASADIPNAAPAVAPADPAPTAPADPASADPTAPAAPARVDPFGPSSPTTFSFPTTPSSNDPFGPSSSSPSLFDFERLRASKKQKTRN